MKKQHYFPCQLTDTEFDYRVGISSKNTAGLAKFFEKNGIRASGKSWEKFVKFLIQTNAPNMSHVIDYASDESGLETAVRNKKDQIRVAEIIHQSCKDRHQLQNLIQRMKY